MAFERLYKNWRQKHLSASQGERRVRLRNRQGHGTAAFVREVWLPLMGSLDELIPEYEVVDAEGLRRYLQLAFVRGGLQVDLEIDGFRAYGTLGDRRTFADERRRDVSLQIGGWQVLRFSDDDVLTHPMECRELLRRWLERWGGSIRRVTEREWRQEQVIALARNRESFVTLSEVSEHLAVCDKTARTIMRELLKLGWFAAAGAGKRRIHRYKLKAGVITLRRCGDAPLR
jgi:hypothetical protein